MKHFCNISFTDLKEFPEESLTESKEIFLKRLQEQPHRTLLEPFLQKFLIKFLEEPLIKFPEESLKNFWKFWKRKSNLEEFLMESHPDIYEEILKLLKESLEILLIEFLKKFQKKIRGATWKIFFQLFFCLIFLEISGDILWTNFWRNIWKNLKNLLEKSLVKFIKKYFEVFLEESLIEIHWFSERIPGESIVQ